jgi:small subunit ribosomal protein S13
MIRIASVTINPKKQARFALTPIKGIGKSNVKKLLVQVKIEPTTKLSDVSEEKIVELRNLIETGFLVESDLRRKNLTDIKHLTDISCWRGLRHKAGLPVRGQTTKTNSRTRRGNKRLTGGSGKIKATKK